MGSKGQLSRVTEAVLAIIVLIILYFIYTHFFSGVGKQLTACDSYCCDNPSLDIAKGLYKEPKGHEWCKDSYWDVSKIDYYTEKIDRIKNYLGKTIDSKHVLGADLNLMCCGRTEDAIVPDSFLPVNLRLGSKSGESEGAPGGGDNKPKEIAVKPKIIAFREGLPLSNGYTMTVYSGIPLSLSFKATGIKSSDGGLQISKTGDLKEYGTLGVYCSVKLLDSDGTDILNRIEVTGTFDSIKNICNKIASNSDSEFNFPSLFIGQTLTLQVLITKQKGIYDPDSYPLDAKYSLRFKVSNPIKIYGLTPSADRSKRIQFACEGVTCNSFLAEVVDKNKECDLSPSQISGFANRPGALDVTMLNEESHRGQVLINDESYDGKLLCVYGITPDLKIFSRKSAIALSIDNTRPRVDAVFMPSELITKVSCYDYPGKGSASGCKDEFGYYYIDNPVDYLGAIFSGMNSNVDAIRWCPRNPDVYITTKNHEIPFVSQADFMILCVRAEDNAGNENKAITLVYNAYDVLLQVVNDQLSKGGPGTGYYGYTGFTR